MREPLLGDSFSSFANTLGPGKSLPVERRRFLQTLGIVGVGLALAPRLVSAKTSAGVWRDCVTGLVVNVADDDYQARVINAELSRASLQYAPAPKPNDFHSHFSAPFIFVESIGARTVRCGNGFQVTQFPLYGTRVPCETCNDLNSSEIKRITNGKEKDYYGCVVAPTGERRNRYHHATYLRTIANYPYDPADFNVAYARNFTTRDAIVPGFYITHKTQKGPTGKPVGDTILGELA